MIYSPAGSVTCGQAIVSSSDDIIGDAKDKKAESFKSI
jgi:hypothetical protein